MTPRTGPGRNAGERDDEGFTLTEIMVGMVILSIFLAIFGGAMVSMFHSVYRTQQTSYAQSNVNIVFSKLESEVRFADAISVPAYVTNVGYEVEFSNLDNGVEMCNELRLTDGGDLMQRTWVADDGSAPSSGTRTLLGHDLNPDTPATASGDNTASVSGPFAQFAATGSSNTQRLEIALSSQDASQVANVTTRVRHVDVTLAALNTDTTTNSDTVCSDGRSSPWPSS